MSEYASPEWEAEERRVCDEAEQKFTSWGRHHEGDLALSFMLMRATLHARVNVLETELQAKHDKLVEVADKLRALEDVKRPPFNPEAVRELLDIIEAGGSGQIWDHPDVDAAAARVRVSEVK